MLILPAIDLLGGHAVRLKQGVEGTAKVYSTQPEKMAQKWQDGGAEMIHVVNLDGAFGRAKENIEAIRKILQVLTIPIELGGGIRNMGSIDQWLRLGVTRVIIGTAAFTQPELVEQAIDKYGAEKIVVGIDGRDNKVAIRGWEEQTERSVIEMANEMKDRGVKRIIFTDVHRDGQLIGPNFQSTDELARRSGLKVIASGGFSTIAHFEQLKALDNPLIEGAIVGTALYEGNLRITDLTSKYRSERTA